MSTQAPNPTPKDTFRAQLAWIEDRIVEARNEFGDTNTVLTHYNYLKLAVLLHQNIGVSGCRREVLMTMGEISRLTFGIEQVVAVGDREVFDRPPQYCYAFPQAAYDIEYRQASEKFRLTIRDQLEFDPNHQYLFNKFIYVLGLRQEWRYCIIPQSVRTALVGNGDLTTMPYHPILAEDFGLEVSVAGEVAFKWRQGSIQPDVVLANNVSGHFRPRDWRAEDLNRALRRTLSLANSVSILAMANDGFAISGPLEGVLGLDSRF